MTICTRKLWNCPILRLWGGSWRQYRSREIARWNQTGEPSATGSKRKKIYKPNKTPYPEIHQQGAEFCLALKRHSAHLPHLKNCLGVWGRLHCMSLKLRFCYSLAPFPLSQRGQVRGQRGEEERTSLQFHAAGEWVRRESGWPLEMIRRSWCTPTYMGALGFFMLS